MICETRRVTLDGQASYEYRLLGETGPDSSESGKAEGKVVVVAAPAVSPNGQLALEVAA